MEQKDQLLHITLMDGMVRGLLLTATHTVAEAAAIHLTSPVATAALGRTLMGTAMMGAMLKADQASVTVTIDGGGPLGRIVCVADHDSVRGCVDVPGLEMPLKPNGKLDVGRAVGCEGRMSVVRDMGMKSPYVGQVPLCRQRADAHAPEPGRAGQRRGGAVGGRGAAAAPAGLYGRYYQPARAAQPNDG